MYKNKLNKCIKFEIVFFTIALISSLIIQILFTLNTITVSETFSIIFFFFHIALTIVMIIATVLKSVLLIKAEDHLEIKGIPWQADVSLLFMIATTFYTAEIGKILLNATAASINLL